MPKIRSIHPDACDNDKLVALSDGAERTLWRLTTHSDDEGRGPDRPMLLANKLYPVDPAKTGDVIDGHLDELVACGMLVRYQVGGKRYYEIHDFTDWQKPKYRSESKIPGPDQGQSTPSPDRDQTEGTGGEGVPDGDGGVSGDGDGGGEVTTSPVGDPDVSEDARTLTREFAKAVKANGHPIPKAGTSAREQWLVEMDRLLRLGPPGDGGHVPDADEVRKVIAFVVSDDFEAPNVQSVPKLRKRYSQLRLKALNGKARASPSQIAAPSTDDPDPDKLKAAGFRTLGANHG